ncbi:MAG: ATP-binding protein [Patescibacteria group bacterium]
MIIPRYLENMIISQFKSYPKAIIIYGPRQIGKTTLSEKIIKKLNLKTLKINADLKTKEVDILSSRNLEQLKQLVSGFELVFIDEAQNINNIGINLKIIIDHFPKIKILATGSSSFNLANKISEPLTGRHWSFLLYPIANIELKKTHTVFELERSLEHQLVFGSYPELFSRKNFQEKQNLLLKISSSYLYKDILKLSNIQHADKLHNLLRLLAFQIGSQVSTLELSKNLELSRSAIENYIDLLEKTFVIKRLGGFSKNLRKEIVKQDKIYFFDLGIRNAIINDFKPLNLRNDVGQLWENFIIMERFKRNAYTNHHCNSYFWRTYTGAEIDYIEEHSGQLFGFEIKNNSKIAKAPKTWIDTYDANFETVNRDNYLKFVT